jgi:hypothetical protein
MADRVKQLEKMGYTVGVAWEGYTDEGTGDTVPTVYRVEGFGTSGTIREDDDDAWAAFADKTAHEHRVNSARAADPDDEFTWTREEETRSAIEAAVATGGMKRKDADKAIKALDSRDEG